MSTNQRCACVMMIMMMMMIIIMIMVVRVCMWKTSDLERLAIWLIRLHTPNKKGGRNVGNDGGSWGVQGPKMGC
jgi:hypothetical protein